MSGGASISGESLGQGEYNPNGGLQKVAGQNGFNKSIGYGKDGDSQSSVTRSGIGTKTIRIGDDGSGEQAKAVYTDTTTENAAARSGSLANNFDAGKVQSELDLQRNVSQSFNQNTQQISTQINANVKEHFDKAKELEKQASDAANNGELQLAQQLADQAAEEYKTAENWQLAGVGVNMVAAGLSAPTDSAGGIAAATLSPAASYKIGQDFKKLAQANADGKLTDKQQAAHVLAHTVLGAAVAAAGGNDPLAGGISAGGAEYLAPKVSQFLYGTDDPEKLTAEQKDTVANIMSLAGAGVGAAVGNSSTNTVQGGLNAESAVENNDGTVLPGPIPLPILLPQKTEAQKEADKQAAIAIEKGVKKAGQTVHSAVGAGFGTIFCTIDSDCPDSNPFKAGQAIWNEGMGNGGGNNDSNSAADGNFGTAGAPMPPDDENGNKGNNSVPIDRLVKNRNGNFIGEVHKGATDNVRTVSQQQFNQIKNEIIKNGRIEGSYSNNKGIWYRLPDGNRVGVRTSGRNGETLDFDVKGLPRDFKIHQK